MREGVLVGYLPGSGAPVSLVDRRRWWGWWSRWGGSGGWRSGELLHTFVRRAEHLLRNSSSACEPVLCARGDLPLLSESSDASPPRRECLGTALPSLLESSHHSSWLKRVWPAPCARHRMFASRVPESQSCRAIALEVAASVATQG